jgi:hypothetical protein
LLHLSEIVACRLATRVICVSRSIRDIASRKCLCTDSKMTVLLGGSSNGVDADHDFNPENFTEASRAATRGRYGIPKDALTIGFIGRIVRDKGIGELVDAWSVLRDEFPSLHLIIVGAPDEDDGPPPRVVAVLRTDPRVHLAGLLWDIAPIYSAIDVLCLPSYREGFPNVILEASAMQVPVVATTVEGCRDAVEDSVTGTLVEARDAVGLASALRAYLIDAGLRRRHGELGRTRVLRDFRRAAVWNALDAEYRGLLRQTHAIRLAFITTVSLSWRLIQGQPEFVRRLGLLVDCISSDGEELRGLGQTGDIRVHAVEMRRQIDPVGDLWALARLCWLFVRRQPDVVHSGTPKGGLLGMIAATIARIPVRVYTVHGFPVCGPLAGRGGGY